jgi:hypothetical protein
MLRAQLEAQIRLAAENETDSGPPARRGVSKKHLAGLHLGERLRAGAALDDDSAPSTLSRGQLGALKMQIVDCIVSLGHGSVEQTRDLLGLVLDDPVIL